MKNIPSLLLITTLSFFLASPSFADPEVSDPASDPSFDFHRTAKHFMYSTLMRQTARGVRRG